MVKSDICLDAFPSDTDRLMELLKETFAFRWDGPVRFYDYNCMLIRDEGDGYLDDARALLRTLWGAHINMGTLEDALEELIEDGLHYSHWPHAWGDDALDAAREEDADREARDQDYEDEQEALYISRFSVGK
jgi:hypothetical protein